MATRSSSRAITPTDRPEPTVAGAIKALALTFVMVAVSGTGACAKATPARNSQGQTSGSFFDPFNKIDGRRWYISNGWSNGAIQGCTWDISRLRTVDGVLEMSIGPAGAANPGCAEIRTHARLGYGTYEARIRTAAGSGLNTAMFTYSGSPLTPVHDEIDFEFLGKSPSQVQLNYFTNGRGGHETFPALPHDASSSFQTVAFEWLPESIRWFIDGKLVREERRAGLPYTPGQFFLSLWGAGPAGTGWLGQIDRSRLPAKAYVDWVAFTRMDEKCLFPESVTCR